MNEVESKIAIVTGAIRGIGKATSSRFKREGITVIETDILPDQDRNDTYEESQSDFKNQFLVHDVTEEKSWKEVVGQVLNRFGKIDILVNNAGIGTLPDFEEEDEKGWETMLSVNSKSIWLEIGRASCRERV